jgi:predicted transcriptional regulator
MVSATATLTITVPQELKDQIEALAVTTGRDTSLLSEDALRQYVEIQSQQIAEITQALRDSDDPDTLASDEEVAAVFARFSDAPAR